MKFNKLAILGVAILLLFRADTSLGQNNIGFEIISSENFSRIVMLEEFAPNETELNSVKSIEFNSASNLLAYGRLQELAFWNQHFSAHRFRHRVAPAPAGMQAAATAAGREW